MVNGQASRDPGEAQGRRVTLQGMLVNLGLVGIKMAASIWGNSQALMADAIHSFSDLVTDLVVLAGLKLGRAPADDRHLYGHARLETAAAALVGLALVGAALYMAWQAAMELSREAAGPPPTWLAVGAAALSVLVKEAVYFQTMRVGRSIGSPAVQANAWHHRSDSLSSVAVLLGVGAAVIHPAWSRLDSAAALVVALFIALAGIKVIGQAGREFTDTAPRPEVLEEMRACALEVEGVRSVHDLRVRSSGGRIQMELHVVVDPELTVRQGHAIAKAVENCLRDDFHTVELVTVHLDPD